MHARLSPPSAPSHPHPHSHPHSHPHPHPHTHPAYLFQTPQTESHAHYTHSRFSLRSPPHDHPQFLHPGPSSCSASPSAPPRTGYPYASHSIDALASYPGPVDAYRPHQYKTQPPSSAWPSTAPATAPTSAMAITVPHYARPAPASSSSGMSSRDGADDSASGSDGGRDPTPPPAARQRGKEVKKKVHACMMCHKSFDRPSTLKKHLLVHTGEKAFSCESCGRRFGVASNLNRHAKTCRAALAGASSDAASGPPASDSRATSSSRTAEPEAAPTAPAEPPADSSVSTASAAPRRPSRKRRRDSDEASVPDASDERQQQPRSRKRARRAPTPERWVPESLRFFDLTPIAKSTPVPLPPVRPFQDTYNQFIEERDSFDENASANPYHPGGWKGRLPGPGLMGHNVANRSGGQLLIF